MKVTSLWFYPIKGLRGIPLQNAILTPRGIKHDRTLMLLRVSQDGSLQKIQLSQFPQCALFSQELVVDPSSSSAKEKIIRVSHHPPPGEDVVVGLPQEALHVPLLPDLSTLGRIQVNLHQSMVMAYRMGSHYDDWFSACFGFETILVHIGDQRRPILGTFSPKVTTTTNPQNNKTWHSSLKNYLPIPSSLHQQKNDHPDWLTFTDCSPLLITTEASLANLSSRLPSPASMLKFRPNIVLDGHNPWDEDFWSDLSLNNQPTFTLSKLCIRCSSINVDYTTGRPATDHNGTLLKTLMSDRRVDPGFAYAPVFGRYAFLRESLAETHVRLGDEVEVTRVNDERPAWDWPIKDGNAARFYPRHV